MICHLTYLQFLANDRGPPHDWQNRCYRDAETPSAARAADEVASAHVFEEDVRRKRDVRDHRRSRRSAAPVEEERPTGKPLPKSKKIVIIGAGMSGMTAAGQLARYVPGVGTACDHGIEPIPTTALS